MLKSLSLLLLTVAGLCGGTIETAGYVACFGDTIDIRGVQARAGSVAVSCPTSNAASIWASDFSSADFAGDGNLTSGYFWASALYGDGLSSWSNIMVNFHLSMIYDVVGGSGPVQLQALNVFTMGDGFEPNCTLTVAGVASNCNYSPLVTVEYGRPFTISIDGTFEAMSGGDLAMGAWGYDFSRVTTADGDRLLIPAPEPSGGLLVLLALAGIVAKPRR